MSLLTLLLQAFLGLTALTTAHILWSYHTSPLKKFPGPFLAKFTNFWRLFDSWTGRSELTQRYLHEKYGSAVRVGPDLVSLAHPELVQKIFDSRGVFVKTDLYKVNDIKVRGQIISNVFSTRDNTDHSRRRSLVSSFYKLQNLLKFEALVDDTINEFFECIDQNFINGANKNKTCKMEDWLLFFAWDVIGRLSFSKSMGFLQAGRDHSGTLNISEKAIDYFAVVTQVPKLDKWFAKNPVRPIGPPTFAVAAEFSAQQVIARQEGNDGKEGKEKRDMLDDFIKLKEKNPNLTDMGVVELLLINMLAGADTTGILLRAILYYVLKNPPVLRKLRQEIDAANLTSPVTYASASKLPYLDAVIRESCRVHPAVGLLLEREVPESGLELPDGTFLPAGTKVGMNSWVVHQDKNVYGQDSAIFNPDRWLRHDEDEDEKSYQERVANMKRCDLTFGGGKRSCLGKYMTEMETYKLIPSLFLEYDIQLLDPTKEWKLQNSWFVRQTGIDVKIFRRSRDN